MPRIPKNTKAHHGPDRQKNSIMLRTLKNYDKLELAETLEQVMAEDPKMQAFVQLLTDATRQNTGIARLAEQCGLSFQAVMDGFRRAKLGEGTLRMFHHVPEVMEQVAQDAKAKMVTCPKCDGLRVVPQRDIMGQVVMEAVEGKPQPVGRECPTCKGAGEVEKSGDPDARKLVFETAGLIGKRGPMVVQQFNSLDGSESPEDTYKALRALPPVITATVEPLPPAEEVKDEP